LERVAVSYLWFRNITIPQSICIYMGSSACMDTVTDEEFLSDHELENVLLKVTSVFVYPCALTYFCNIKREDLKQLFKCGFVKKSS